MPAAVKLPELVHCFPRAISAAEADALICRIVLATRYTAQAVAVTEKKLSPFDADSFKNFAISNKGYFASGGANVQYEFRHSKPATEPVYGMLELKLGPVVSPKDDAHKTAMARFILRVSEEYFSSKRQEP